MIFYLCKNIYKKRTIKKKIARKNSELKKKNQFSKTPHWINLTVCKKKQTIFLFLLWLEFQFGITWRVLSNKNLHIVINIGLKHWYRPISMILWRGTSFLERPRIDACNIVQDNWIPLSNKTKKKIKKKKWYFFFHKKWLYPYLLKW